MNAGNLEFTGAGFDSFNLAAETQRDGAPLLADKIARIEAEAVEEKQQCTFMAPDSYKIREVRAHVVHEQAVEPAAVHWVTTPEGEARFWHGIIELHPMFDPAKEAVCVVMLNRKNRTIGWHFLTLGTATSAMCHPREVLRICLVAGAVAFVVMHNHPSGDPTPSAADITATRSVRDAARAVDMAFVDHVVIGQPAFDARGLGWFSFRQNGML